MTTASMRRLTCHRQRPSTAGTTRHSNVSFRGIITEQGTWEGEGRESWMLHYRLSCPSEQSFPLLQLSVAARNELLGSLHPERDREDIARFHPLHPWLVERPHERKWVRCRLRHTLPLKEPVLAQVYGSFHLPGRKVEPHRDCQVITRLQRCVHLLLVHRRQAGQELRVVGGCFSLRDVKDALPLSVAVDLGGNPEVCLKHLLLLSVRMRFYHMSAFLRRNPFPRKEGAFAI